MGHSEFAFNSFTQEWGTTPHFEEAGCCVCDCAICSDDESLDYNCICSDCNREKCGMHEPV